jgi:hypothetical protein
VCWSGCGVRLAWFTDRSASCEGRLLLECVFYDNVSIIYMVRYESLTARVDRSLLGVIRTRAGRSNETNNMRVVSQPAVTRHLE